MKQTRFSILGVLVLAGTCLSICVSGASAQQFKTASGKVAGVVNDTSGVPQMGATVQLIAEGGLSAVDFLTNTQGVFRSDKVLPGMYTVRVTLAGFLADDRTARAHQSACDDRRPRRSSSRCSRHSMPCGARLQ